MKLTFTRICSGALFLLLFLGSPGVTRADHSVLIERQLTEVLSEISERYQVIITYDAGTVEGIKVDYAARELPSDFESALSMIIEQTSLEYKSISAKYYVIYRDDFRGRRDIRKLERKMRQIQKIESSGNVSVGRKQSEGNNNFSRIIENAQRLAPDNIDVSGTVTDEDGEPLIGVNIQVKGSNKGTSTDFDGNFYLEDLDENAVLVVSYIGYQTQEIAVQGSSNLEIIMLSDSQLLDEVVVVGYGTQKKVNVTGAITTISDDYLHSRSASSVSQLLQGQSSGVDLGVSKTGFAPGAQMDIDIRGMSSLSGTSPLIVVNGIPGKMDDLNPEDIESISILKDAASAAIYGARASNGVILITTKSGTKRELSATYSGSVTLNNPMELPKMLDSYTFARVHNEAAQNTGARYYRNEVVDRIIAYQNEDWNYLKQFMPEGSTHFETVPLNDGSWGTKWDAHANYDWFDIYFGSALNQKHNFSIDGGTDRLLYYFSAGHTEENSYIKHTDDTFKRLNFSGRITSSITDWWDFTIETRFTKSSKVRPNLNYDNGSSDYLDFFKTVFQAPPTNALYDGNGNINNFMGNFRNLMESMQNGGVNSFTNNTQQYTFYTTINPVKGWSINADYTYRTYDRYETDVIKRIPYYLVDNTVAYHENVNGFLAKHNSDYYWTTNVYSSYEANLVSGHNFGVLAGLQFEYDASRYMFAKQNDLLVQDVPSLSTAIGALTATDALNHWATQGYFGRFNYNYKEKYLFESNIRYDGTSRFAEGSRWGLFPSASVGWMPSREIFWEPIYPYINSLKLRGSWGALGNQNVSPYSDLELIPINSATVNWLFQYNGDFPFGYTGTPSIASPGLTWETVTTKNLGVDMAFLDHRLTLGLDLFERNTTDMIGPSEQKPGVLGVSVPSSNNASLQTRGWELELGWKQRVSNDLSYGVNLNIYDNHTKITKYNNPNNLIDSWYVGKVAGEIWGYESNGLFQSEEEIENHASQSHIYGNWRPGDVKYEDLNGDGRINEGNRTLDNHGDLKIIGNRSSRYQFGISGNISYRGFDFSMLWRGVGKRDLDHHLTGYGSQAYFGFLTQTWSAINDIHLDYYRDQPGDKYTGLYEGDKNINLDAWLPRPYLSSVENPKNRQVSTRYLLNGAFMRLQYVQIGYNLPERAISRLGLSKVRMHLTGDNLLTFSHMPKGVDPVAVTGFYTLGTTYGVGRGFTFGLTVQY